jgi:hypothetical protein
MPLMGGELAKIVPLARPARRALGPMSIPRPCLFPTCLFPKRKQPERRARPCRRHGDGAGWPFAHALRVPDNIALLPSLLPLLLPLPPYRLERDAEILRRLSAHHLVRFAQDVRRQPRRNSLAKGTPLLPPPPLALLGSEARIARTAALGRIAAIASRAWRSWIPSYGRWYTTASSPMAKTPTPPAPPSCQSASSSPIPSSAKTDPGSQIMLDPQHRCSSGPHLREGPLLPQAEEGARAPRPRYSGSAWLSIRGGESDSVLATPAFTAD